MFFHQKTPRLSRCTMYVSDMGSMKRYSAETPQHTTARWMLAGVAAASLVLSACSGESEPRDRNAPPSAEYFLDYTGMYYRHLQDARQLTNNKVAIENIRRLEKTPIATWLNEPIDVTLDVLRPSLAQSTANGTIPLFVAYNSPFRDLGGPSSGGAADAAEYSEWISAVSETIADHSAIMILEPDSLAGAPEIDDAVLRGERISSLRDALRKFKENNGNTAVYLDVGHSKWLTPVGAADLIREIDPDGQLVTGISLNVSNQRPESEIRDYAEQIFESLGRKLYVMSDNAMNGSPNTAELFDWCNVPGEKIGKADDTSFDSDLLFEEAFIKPAGESDASCGASNAPPGVFDTELLLQQVS